MSTAYVYSFTNIMRKYTTQRYVRGRQVVTLHYRHNQIEATVSVATEVLNLTELELIITNRYVNYNGVLKVDVFCEFC